MAINKKFISFATQAQFDAYLANNNIDPRSIVFIENTKRIWTHGVFFDTPTSWNYVTDKPETFTPSAHTLGSHSDVTITSNTSGEILKWNGTKWINNTLAEAGIASTGQLSNYLPLSGGTLTGTLSTNSLINMTFRGSVGSDTSYIELMGVSANDAANENSGAFINFRTSTSAGYGAMIGGHRKSGGSSAMVFKTGNQNPGITMYLSETGSLGIGTTSPAYKLDVSGTGRFTGNVTAPTFSGSLSGNASSATNISNSGTVTLATATESNAITITQPSYVSGKPVKLLNFNWYATTWSLGNIRGGSTDTQGLGIYLGGVEKFRFSDGSLKVGSNTVYHSGNFANGTTSQYIRGDGSLATYSDTTYSAMSVAEGIAGTATSLRTMRADYLKQIIQHYAVDTNSVTGIRAGASETTTNSTATNPYIKVIDDNTYRSQIRLVGSGATTVSSDASGNITISSTDSNTTYSTGTLAQLNAGTDTTGRLQTAKLLNDWLNPKLDGKLDLTGGTVSGLITSTTSNTSAAFYKSSSTGTAFARIGAATYDKGFGVSNTGDLIFGDWSSVSSLSSSWDKVYHTGNLNLTTLGGVPTSRTITAGNGLTGGGALSADRTITLGTPSDITATSTNSVTATSHTHKLSMGSGSGLDADLLDGLDSIYYKKGVGKGSYYKDVVNISLHNTAHEILIKTKIPFISSSQMPLIHLEGYAYGANSPIEIRIAFYIYSGAFSSYGCTSTCPWDPDIKLFTYVEGSTTYVGIALIKSIYFPQCSVNYIDIWGGGTGVQSRNYSEGWTVEFNTVSSPSIVPSDNLVSVPYKSIANNITGNATTASTLQTARAINGTNFDGSSNITTANWGTARTLTIGSTGKSVNGSANVSWSLAEIGAQAAGSYVTDTEFASLIDQINGTVI